MLGIVIGVCTEHQNKGQDFDQMPFQRIFIMLFYELCAPEAILESINWHTLQAFTNAYHYLRPIKGTGVDAIIKSFMFKVILDYFGLKFKVILKFLASEKGDPFELFVFSARLCVFVDRTDRIQNVRHAHDATHARPKGVAHVRTGNYESQFTLFPAPCMGVSCLKFAKPEGRVSNVSILYLFSCCRTCSSLWVRT